MRIQKLTLKNFRSHQETVLELDRLNFIRGPNGCGKSSIQMALEYLFTGRCQLTDGAGRGAEALIRVGEKELAVSATLENGDTISRRRTPRSQIVEINGKRLPVDTAQVALEKRFGPADVLSAVLNADRFVAMSEAEQKKFLAQVVDAGRIEIPEQIRDALRTIGEEQPKLASLRDIEAAHKRFLGLYEEASRTLQALGQSEQLEASRRETSRCNFRKSDADTCRRNAQSPIQQAEAEIEEPLFELPSLWEEEELRQSESWLSRAKELRRQLADLGAEREAVEKSLTVMQRLKGKCPCCGQLVPEAAKAKEMEILRERLAELESLIQSTRGELNCYRNPEEVASGPEDQATQKPGAAGVRGRIPICTEGNHEGSLAAAKDPQPRVAKGPSEACASDKSVLEGKLSILKSLIDFFGPNGAVINQASLRMEPLKEKLNQQLAIFGYACNLTLEPFEIRVASSSCGGSGLLLKQLSESERFRFGIAFQLALAVTTGIRFVIIDRADALDKPRRKELTALLLKSDVDQAIVLATGEEPPPVSIPSGVKFLDLIPTNAASRTEGSSPKVGSEGQPSPTIPIVPLAAMEISGSLLPSGRNGGVLVKFRP
jgi:hypothetical protein